MARILTTLGLALLLATAAAADRTVNASEVVIVSDEIRKRVTELRHAAGAPVREAGRTWAPVLPTKGPTKESASETAPKP